MKGIMSHCHWYAPWNSTAIAPSEFHYYLHRRTKVWSLVEWPIVSTECLVMFIPLPPSLRLSPSYSCAPFSVPSPDLRLSVLPRFITLLSSLEVLFPSLKINTDVLRLNMARSDRSRGYDNSDGNSLKKIFNSWNAANKNCTKLEERYMEEKRQKKECHIFWSRWATAWRTAQKAEPNFR